MANPNRDSTTGRYTSGGGGGVPIAEGTVRIGTDLSGVDKGMASLRGKLSRFSFGVAGALKGAVMAPSNIASSLSVSAGKIALILGGIAGAFAMVAKESVSAASSFNETMSKFNVVFGAEAAATYEWAEQFASAANRGRAEIVSLLATTQDFFVPMGLARDKAAEMSKVLVKLATDIGSFANLSTEEAFTKLISGVAGETEAVRRLGIDISDATMKQYAFDQGITQSWDSVSFATKAILRMNKMLEDSTDAQGDAIRTADQWANATRGLAGHFEDLKETIGTQLIPMLEPYLAKIVQIVKASSEWIRQNPGFVAGMFEIGRALGVVAGIAAGVSGLLAGMAIAVSPLGLAFGFLYKVAHDLGLVRLNLEGLMDSVQPFMQPITDLGVAIWAKMKVEAKRFFLYILWHLEKLIDWGKTFFAGVLPQLSGVGETITDALVIGLAAIMPKAASMAIAALAQVLKWTLRAANELVAGVVMSLFKALRLLPGAARFLPTEAEMRAAMSLAVDLANPISDALVTGALAVPQAITDAIADMGISQVAAAGQEAFAGILDHPEFLLHDLQAQLRSGLFGERIEAREGLEAAVGGLQSIVDSLGQAMPAPGDTLPRIPPEWGGEGAGKKGPADTFGMWGSQGLSELMGFSQRNPAKDQLRETQRTNSLLTDILSATELQTAAPARYAP